MHEQDLAVVKSLMPVAWADGVFAEKEKEMLEALLEAYAATDDEKAAVRAYASERRTLDDIPLQELSAGDRRTLLQHAVLLSYADGEQGAEEKAVIDALAVKLKIPADEAKGLMEAAATRARRHLGALKG